MTDVTIHPDNAKRFASYLRGTTTVGYYPWVHELADLLDPPTPSLRDECIKVVQSVIANYDDCAYERSAVDAVLAVVRRHVEAMDVWADDDVRGDQWNHARDAVLQLLGGSDA